MDITQTVKDAANWPFLNEPIYRWFLFIIILSALLGAWSSAIRHMK